MVDAQQVPISVQRLSAHRVLVRGPELLSEWHERQRTFVPGYTHMPRYQAGGWDGTWTPGVLRRWGDDWELRCSTGMARKLLHDLTGSSSALDVAVASEVEAFMQSEPWQANSGELRGMQVAALKSALLAGWGRVSLATNAGKGAVIAILAQWARLRDLRALVLCDELAVYDAIEGELTTWTGRGPGHVRAGCSTPPRTVVTLAMVQTLAKRLHGAGRDSWKAWIREHGVLLLDEADKASASMWREILHHATNATWRVGFSGTFPAPDDKYADLIMTNLMGPIIAEARNRELISAGISAKPTIELHGYDTTAALRQARLRGFSRMPGTSQRQALYDAAISDNLARHELIASLVRPDVPTTVIVNRIDHGHQLSAAIPGSVFLDGSADPRERKRVLNSFLAGDVKVLVVTKILDRGTNRLGSAADLIFASGEGSSRQTLQRIGRGLRRTDGKAALRLVDIVDRVELHGNDSYAMEKAAEFIHSAGQARVRLYAEEGFDVILHPRARSAQ